MYSSIMRKGNIIRRTYNVFLHHHRHRHHHQIVSVLNNNGISNNINSMNTSTFRSNRSFHMTSMSCNGNNNNDTNDNGTRIQVTQTSSSSSCQSNNNESSTTCSSDNNNTTSTTTNTDTTNTTTTRQKSTQQIEEEKLYNLMSQSKQHYQYANYTKALSISNEFLQKAIELFGTTLHPVVASGYNNIGLMNKMIGEYDIARTSYYEALNIYKKVVGDDHANYASTIHNLAVLDKTQCVMDDTLSILERMNLIDRSIEYFEIALQIREVELGLEHVHTVTSRSNLGNAIAAQVIQTEVLRQKRRQAALSSTTEKKGKDDNDGDIATDVETTSSNTVSKLTKQKWQMAETNLRDALRMAIDNPRGKMINLPSSASTTTTTRSMKRKGSARQRKIAKQKQEKEKNIPNEESIESFLGLGDISIRTESSALAAQNLAVFLKTRADLISTSERNGEATTATAIEPSLDSGDMYAEAKNLYIGALRVRSQLKGDSHPDTVSTKFSLAELIDTLGDEDGANKLRQQLLDIYEIEERDGMVESNDDSGSTDDDKR